MAADVRAARREARRRRILENSENRLQRITGKYGSGSDVSTETTVTTFEEEETSSKSNVRRDALNGLIRPVKGEQGSPEHFQSAGSKYADEILRRVQQCNSSYTKLGVTEDNASDEETTPRRKVIEQQVRRRQFFAWNLHVVVLAVFTRLMYTLQFGYVFNEMMFLPLLLLLLSELLLPNSLTTSNSHGILGGVLILLGLPPQLITTCAYCVTIASHIVGAFAIYLVAFTFTDCVVSSMIPTDTG